MLCCLCINPKCSFMKCYVRRKMVLSCWEHYYLESDRSWTGILTTLTNCLTTSHSTQFDLLQFSKVQRTVESCLFCHRFGNIAWIFPEHTFLSKLARAGLVTETTVVSVARWLQPLLHSWRRHITRLTSGAARWRHRWGGRTAPPLGHELEVAHISSAHIP